MADWLESAQRHWESARTDKAAENYPDIRMWIDYHNKLTNQGPGRRFRVIYNARGADSFCTVIDRTSLPDWTFGSVTLRPTDVLGDSTNFCFETNDGTEAHFLAAVLNAPSVHKAVKPFQPRGAFGPRDIGRRPLMLSIPKFDPRNAAHMRLVTISKQAHAKVAAMSFSNPSFRIRRKGAAKALESEIAEIDTIVQSLGIPAPVIGMSDSGDMEESSMSDFDEDSA